MEPFDFFRFVIFGFYGGFKIFCKDIKEMKQFRHIFAVFSIIGAIILFVIMLFSDLKLLYLIYYLVFCIYTFFLISEISTIISIKKKISKWEFFKHIFIYLFIMASYISLFANVYYTSFILEDGGFVLNGKIYLINELDSYFISGLSSLSYNLDFSPSGLIKLFMFIQIFFSQIMILGFLFIMINILLKCVK